MYVPAVESAQKTGERFRLILTMRAPSTSLVINALKAAFTTHAALDGRFRIEKFEWRIPAPSLDTAQIEWTFTVYYVVTAKEQIQTAGLDPRVIYALAVLIVTGLFSFSLAGKRLEKFVGDTADRTHDIIKTVLNPGVLVLVVLGLFLITRRGN